MSGFFAGAVITTFFAPAVRCFAASSRLVKRPVDSNTTSTPSAFHGSCAGSFIDRTWNSSPPTVIRSPFAEMSALRLPRIESYLRRCASVLASVRSLTATMSMSAVAHGGAHDVAADAAEPVDPNFHSHRKLLRRGARRSDVPVRCAETFDCSERLARWSNRGLQLSRISGPCTPAYSVLIVALFVVMSPVPPLSGAPLPEVHHQPQAAHGLSAGVVQPRRRQLDLDSRRLGRRGADRAGAAAGAARALPAAQDLPVDDDHDRAADRRQEPPVRRSGLLLPVRSRLRRRAHAAAGQAAALHHDGDRDLAEPAARLPPRRRQDGARQRPHLEPLLPALPAGPPAVPPRAAARRSLLHAERRVGAPHHRPRRAARARLGDRLAEVRLARVPRRRRPARRRRSAPGPRPQPRAALLPHQPRTARW